MSERPTLNLSTLADAETTGIAAPCPPHHQLNLPQTPSEEHREIRPEIKEEKATKPTHATVDLSDKEFREMIEEWLSSPEGPGNASDESVSLRRPKEIREAIERLYYAKKNGEKRGTAEVFRSLSS